MGADRHAGRMLRIDTRLVRLRISGIIDRIGVITVVDIDLQAGELDVQSIGGLEDPLGPKSVLVLPIGVIPVQIEIVIIPVGVVVLAANRTPESRESMGPLMTAPSDLLL